MFHVAVHTWLGTTRQGGPLPECPCMCVYCRVVMVMAETLLVLQHTAPHASLGSHQAHVAMSIQHTVVSQIA